MGKNWVSFRLSDDCMTVLTKHQSDLSTAAGKEIDRTQALEHIIGEFAKERSKPIARLKRAFMRIPEASFAKGDRPLEAFFNELRPDCGSSVKKGECRIISCGREECDWRKVNAENPQALPTQ
jgi:hypothetical protein